MNKDDQTAAMIDALIDTLAELESIEATARDARERLSPVCSALYQHWCSKQDQHLL